MPVLPDYAPPKGSVDMILFHERNDDITISLPAMPFSVPYNETAIDTLFTSGNSWVGFGSGSEHLLIGRRDASYNKLFYAAETEHGLTTFRIRFEGNSTYSAWGTNDLLWELTIFEDGVFQLVIEKSPRNGTDSFLNPAIGTVPCTFETGKSYVFQGVNGCNYVISEGSYLPHVLSYLAEDAEGVKAFDAEQKQWIVVSQPPITEELFLNHGNGRLPNSLVGLEAEAVLHCYTDNSDITTDLPNHKFHISEIVTSKPKTIIQSEGFVLEIGRRIEKLELRTKINGGKIRMAISVDSGVTWLTFLDGEYVEIDTLDLTAFSQNGIAPEFVETLNMQKLNDILIGTLRFAYLLEKPKLADICKLKAVKIIYEQNS